MFYKTKRSEKQKVSSSRVIKKKKSYYSKGKKKESNQDPICSQTSSFFKIIWKILQLESERSKKTHTHTHTPQPRTSCVVCLFVKKKNRKFQCGPTLWATNSSCCIHTDLQFSTPWSLTFEIPHTHTHSTTHPYTHYCCMIG